MNHHNTGFKVCACFLGLLAALKVLDSASDHPFLMEPDTVFPFLNNRQMLFVGAALESAVAMFLFARQQVRSQAQSLLWFVGIVVTYKIGLHWTESIAPCNCLGLLGRVSGMQGESLTFVTWLILGLFAVLGFAGWMKDTKTVDVENQESN